MASKSSSKLSSISIRRVLELDSHDDDINKPMLPSCIDGIHCLNDFCGESFNMEVDVFKLHFSMVK